MKSFFRSALILATALLMLLIASGSYLFLVHLPPKDLALMNRILRRGSVDIISQDHSFKIWEMGEKIEIPFTAPCTNTYSLQLSFKETFPPSGMIYSGSLLIRYYQGNTLVMSNTYSKMDTSRASQNSTTPSILLDTQVLPLYGGPAEHSVVIEVLTADKRFEQYKDAMRIHVRGHNDW
jgi:hypothetical protein